MDGVRATWIRQRLSEWTWRDGRGVVQAILLIGFCYASAGKAADLAELYGSVSGKTVLMRSQLPVAGSIIPELPDDKTNAIKQMEEEFGKQGIAVIQDGPHFVILVPKEEAHSLTNIISLRGQELAASRGNQELPAGVINLMNVSAQDVLPLYSELSRRTVLRSGITPVGLVRLKTTCPLTRAEASYALETVLELNGTAVVRDGNKFVQAVPMVQRSMVVSRAPKVEPGAPLLDPRKVPSIGDSHQPRPTSQFERDFERYRKAFYEFIHYKGPEERSSQRLLEFYAHLANKRAVSSTNFGGMPIWFHVETPVTKSELMYAIETTFHLNWLGITNIDEKHIGLGRVQDWGGK